MTLKKIDNWLLYIPYLWGAGEGGTVVKSLVMFFFKDYFMIFFFPLSADAMISSR